MREMGTKTKLILGGIVVFILLLLFLSCTRVVNTGEVAVVTSFGQIKSTQTQGFHFKAPWQKYNKVNVTQQQISANYSTATKDSQSVTQTISAQVQIDVTKVKELYGKFLNNHIDSLVKPVFQDGFKTATADYTIEQNIQIRDEVAASMLKQVKTKLEPYGINVVSVEIKNVDLPEEYKDAVNKQKVAEKNKITAKVKLETAEIDAKTNKALAKSLSDENFQQMFYEKWDGKLPTYMGNDLNGFIMNNK